MHSDGIFASDEHSVAPVGEFVGARGYCAENMGNVRRKRNQYIGCDVYFMDDQSDYTRVGGDCVYCQCKHFKIIGL